MVADLARFPPPPVPPWADLRRFATMPIDVLWIRDCGLTVRLSGDEFRAWVTLACVSWHQRPAGSLPTDDAQLAALAGYGIAVKAWRKVRSKALDGWQICSDNRQYHPQVSEKVHFALDQQSQHAWRRECSRIRQHNKRHKADLPMPTFEAFTAEFREAGSESGPGNEPPEADDDYDVSHEQKPSVTRTDGAGHTGIPTRVEREWIGPDRNGSTDSPPKPPSGGIEEDARGLSLSKAWSPTGSDRQFAADLGLDAGVQFAAFRDKFLASGRARRRDWDAAWRDFCRRAAEAARPKSAFQARGAAAQARIDETRALEARIYGTRPQPDTFDGPTIDGAETD